MKKKIMIASVILAVLAAAGGFFYWESVKLEEQKREEKPPCYTLTVLSPVTGALSYIGEPAKWAVEYAARMINEEGGIGGIPVEVNVMDTEFSEDRVKYFENSIFENERFFLGPMDSPGTSAGIEKVVENKIPNIACYSYESIRREAAPYGISYMSDSTEGEIEAVEIWKKLNPDIRKVVIFVSPSDTSQMATASLMEETLKEMDMTVLKVITIDLSQNNGLNAVASALNSRADGYIFLSRAEEYGVVISELRKRGISEGRRITASFASFENTMVESHQEALADTYIWNKFDQQYEGALWQKLVTAYKADHDGNAPDSSVVSDMYNAVMAWKQCITELGLGTEVTDLAEERQMIADWFYHSPVQSGIQGEYQWIQGKKMSSVYYFQFDKDGNRVLVNP